LGFTTPMASDFCRVATTSPAGVRVSALAPSGASNQVERVPSGAMRRIRPAALLVNSTPPSVSGIGPSTASNPSCSISTGVPARTTPSMAGVVAGAAASAPRERTQASATMAAMDFIFMSGPR
jgi:hypothetical protein